MWIAILPAETENLIIVEVKSVLMINKEREDLWCIRLEDDCVYFNPKTTIVKVFYEPLGLQAFLKRYLELLT